MTIERKAQLWFAFVISVSTLAIAYTFFAQ